jgi:alanine dehydrogenase
MTLFLTDESVRASFGWADAVESLELAYSKEIGERRFPNRTMARGQGSWLRTLSGVPADTGLMGAKLIAVSTRGPRASYLIPLFDEQTAELVALLDGHSITGFRTAATSALATNLLAPPGPVTLALIGSGFEAQNHVRALSAIRQLDAVHVYSPRPESRARFAEALADLAVPIHTRDSAASAVADASVVICAARSRDESPTMLGEWMRPGMTVVSIGSTLPEQREVDSEVIRRADVMVVDMVHEVLQDTGDLIAAAAEGIDAGDRTVSLADLVSGRRPGREKPDQIVLYKSVGSAVQDLAVAALCLRRALQTGIGMHMPATIRPVVK